MVLDNILPVLQTMREAFLFFLVCATGISATRCTDGFLEV